MAPFRLPRMGRCLGLVLAALLWPPTRAAAGGARSAAPPPDDHQAALFALGPHLVQGFVGTAPEQPGVVALRARAERCLLGGVYLGRHNLRSPALAQALVGAMRRWQVPAPCGPLLIVTDAPDGVAAWPGAAALAGLSAGRRAARYETLAAALAEAGVDVVLLPLACQRSTASRRRAGWGQCQAGAALAEDAALLRRILARHGVVLGASDFPAQGDAGGGPRDLTRALRGRGLAKLVAPFGALIADGLQVVASAPVTDLVRAPSGLPLSYDPELMRGTLRAGLHFAGVTLSHDVRLAPPSARQPFVPPAPSTVSQSLAAALAAGHDLLLLDSQPQPPEGWAATARELDQNGSTAMQGMVGTGRLTPAALADSKARVARLRTRKKAPPAAAPARPVAAR